MWLIIALALLAGLPLAAEPWHRGRAVVTDGDTIRLAGMRIRLHGIDAPELAQTCRTEQGQNWPCGQGVSTALAEKINGQQVACLGIERDRYQRLVAKCYVGGEDISRWLVDRGLALAYRKYSTDYVAAERQAKARAAGLWAGVVQAPAAFRLVAQKAGKPPNAKCAIKGNISKSGRIYHVPGSKWYARTKIDTRRGERWFCSVDEARKAGWRAPRG